VAPVAQSRRTPAARPRPKSPSRVKRRRRRKARPRNDAELIGLGLVAVGIFLACVLWLGLNGGPVPHAVTRALGWAAYLTPLVFCPLGALVVARSELIRVRAFQLGALLSLGGLMAALGRGHGGAVGRGVESVLGQGVGSIGTTILGVLATLVGVLPEVNVASLASAPVPRLRYTPRCPSLSAVNTSGWPSPLTSPTASALGVCPE